MSAEVAAKQRGVMTYKGNPRIQTEKNYKLSNEVKNLLLVRENYYRLLPLRHLSPDAYDPDKDRPEIKKAPPTVRAGRA